MAKINATLSEINFQDDPQKLSPLFTFINPNTSNKNAFEITADIFLQLLETAYSQIEEFLLSSPFIRIVLSYIDEGKMIKILKYFTENNSDFANSQIENGLIEQLLMQISSNKPIILDSIQCLASLLIYPFSRSKYQMIYESLTRIISTQQCDIVFIHLLGVLAH